MPLGGRSALRQLASAALRPGVLLGVVVLPLDAHRAVEADAVQLDEDLLERCWRRGRCRR